MSEDEWDCIVSKTEGYSGSDMRNLMQEAASFAVREATKDALRSAEPLAVSPQDIRPVNLDDFQVGSAALLLLATPCCTCPPQWCVVTRFH